MKTGKDLLGSIFPSNKSGDMEIIEYRGYHKIKVRFVNTGYETMAELGQIRKGNVKDHSLLTGYEAGTVHKSNNFGEFEIIEYNNSLDVKIRFFNTGYEYTVCASQIKDGRIKDPYAPTVYGVGVTGNKVYSEDTCVFLPRAINIALTHRKDIDNKLPVGVFPITNSINTYQANIKLDGKTHYLGSFKTPELAFRAYKEKKEWILKQLAFKWGEKLDPRAERALYQYEVDIND